MIGAAAASSIGARKGFSTGEADPSADAGLRVFLTSGRRNLDRCEPFPEAGFDRVGVGVDQRVLGRKVLVDPVRGFVGGLELADVGEQLFPQRR